ncbi:histidine phosphatase family protein [Pseudonocardia asaccharolytica]|uniref:Phosphoglycerate mutase n=1 Tax=Pseudonocardia asaccharolytica DSM 44247 = NBRC 16224 TaxID=1123024 RepID=A0A511CYI0_9PSEU|nr:histidine phosphatase family protein [Pseudonocardia asaccharolytica]GEL17612.1 phosphoglycerate mutase [Pseudonocardia asaccharolytica DSM 44247 = NBRC 16224]
MQLVLVRHALPHQVSAAELGEAGDAAAADPGLTELGERQAVRLVGALSGEDIAALYSSTMARAVGTVAPLAAALGRQPQRVAELAEYDANDRHYVPVHEMARLAPESYARLRAGLLPPHVDVEAFRTRVVGAVESIVATHPGRETAVLVAHAGVINIYLAHLLGIPRPLAFPLDYTGITRVLAGRDGRRSVRSVNETAHVADLLAEVPVPARE